jgi:drug/metabolite transporter (DMT)-like permease
VNKNIFSLICAIVTSILWGSAFVAQDMGMDFIGPHTFNVGRFLVGFLTLLPFFLFFDLKKIRKKKINIKKNLSYLILL